MLLLFLGHRKNALRESLLQLIALGKDCWVRQRADKCLNLNGLDSCPPQGRGLVMVRVSTRSEAPSPVYSTVQAIGLRFPLDTKKPRGLMRV